MTTMYTRHFKFPSRSFFIFGARGTGKTTLIKSSLKNTYFINLLDEKKYQNYLGDIEIFDREIKSVPKDKIIVVDEIQRLPELLNYVHEHIEANKRTFILTGSSARKLRQKGVNLLAGRAGVKYLYPLLPTEMGPDFDLALALQFGTLPIVVDSLEKSETLEAYTITYLQQEIKAEALVRNLSSFTRFLSIAALFHGQTINVSNVARDAAIARTTVNGYFEILLDTLVASFLPAYTSNSKVREVKHPKFYFFDPGIVRTLKKQSGPADDDEKGFLFEGFVYHCLTAYNAYNKFYDEIFYWSPLDTNDTEVDFVLRQNKSLIAIEVKAKPRINPKDLKGLKAISSLKNVKKKYLIYMGKEIQTFEDGCIAIPLVDFCNLISKGKV